MQIQSAPGTRVLGAVVAAPLLLCGCGREVEPRPNVVVIVVDTLRADRLLFRIRRRRLGSPQVAADSPEPRVGVRQRVREELVRLGQERQGRRVPAALLGAEVELIDAATGESVGEWLATGRISGAEELKSDEHGEVRLIGLPRGSYGWSATPHREVSRYRRARKRSA